jgi:hypothetical protein
MLFVDVDKAAATSSAAKSIRFAKGVYHKPPLSLTPSHALATTTGSLTG